METFESMSTTLVNQQGEAYVLVDKNINVEEMTNVKTSTQVSFDRAVIESDYEAVEMSVMTAVMESLTAGCKQWPSGISLGMRLANERRRYNVTTSLIGWEYT